MRPVHHVFGVCFGLFVRLVWRHPFLLRSWYVSMNSPCISCAGNANDCASPVLQTPATCAAATQRGILRRWFPSAAALVSQRPLVSFDVLSLAASLDAAAPRFEILSAVLQPPVSGTYGFRVALSDTGVAILTGSNGTALWTIINGGEASAVLSTTDTYTITSTLVSSASGTVSHTLFWSLPSNIFRFVESDILRPFPPSFLPVTVPYIRVPLLT